MKLKDLFESDVKDLYFMNSLPIIISEICEVSEATLNELLESRINDRRFSMAHNLYGHHILVYWSGQGYIYYKEKT